MIKMYLDRRPRAVPSRSASLALPVFLAAFSGACVIRSHRLALLPRVHRVCLSFSGALDLRSSCKNLTQAPLCAGQSVALLLISALPRRPQSPSLACPGAVWQATRSNHSDAALAALAYSGLFLQRWRIEYVKLRMSAPLARRGRLPGLKAKTRTKSVKCQSYSSYGSKQCVPTSSNSWD